MKLTHEIKLELERKSAAMASQLAAKLEEVLQAQLTNSEEDAILQMLVYSQLASWYIAAHLTTIKLHNKQMDSKREIPFGAIIQDIANHGIDMFTNYKIERERH